jgi:hypothetical protein
VAEAFIGQRPLLGKAGSRSTLVEAADGQFLTGVDAKGKGTLTYTVSLPPEFQEGPPSDATVNRLLPNGRSQVLVSALAYETANNPDGDIEFGLAQASQACRDAYTALGEPFGPGIMTGEVDSNPYAVAIDGGSRIVADAAGNTLLRVAANGRVSTLAVFPAQSVPITEELVAPFAAELQACIGQPFMAQPVPTDVEVGPDGNYFVSLLPGSESFGTAKVMKVNRSTGAISEVAHGLTTATDLAVASDGTIYVAELFLGQVARIDPGQHTASATAAVPCASAVEIGPDGMVYAAEAGICQDGPPEPGRIVAVQF